MPADNSAAASSPNADDDAESVISVDSDGSDDSDSSDDSVASSQTSVGTAPDATGESVEKASATTETPTTGSAVAADDSKKTEDAKKAESSPADTTAAAVLTEDSQSTAAPVSITPSVSADVVQVEAPVSSTADVGTSETIALKPVSTYSSSGLNPSDHSFKAIYRRWKSRRAGRHEAKIASLSAEKSSVEAALAGTWKAIDTIQENTPPLSVWTNETQATMARYRQDAWNQTSRSHKLMDDIESRLTRRRRIDNLPKEFSSRYPQTRHIKRGRQTIKTCAYETAKLLTDGPLNDADRARVGYLKTVGDETTRSVKDLLAQRTAAYAETCMKRGLTQVTPVIPDS